MITIEDLGLKYDTETALKNINLHISKNSTCAIIGPSGCGKTTLLYALAGLLSTDEGQIYINNEKLQGIRKSTGVILQNGGLLPWKSTWDNIALGLLSRGVDKQEVEKRVNAIIEELGMTDHKEKFPAQLSGGQRQRAAIARTLVMKPDLLLLDEASSALDAITKEHIQNLLLKLYKKQPMTLVMVTHSIEEAVFLGQSIVVMEKASIKHKIDNPYFGDVDIRSKPEYYNICQEVRKWLYEGDVL